jgi:hypothetical protein
MSPARTMIALMTAHIIMDVHSPNICASKCQCPFQTGLGFHAILQFSGGDSLSFGLPRFPPCNESCP